MSNVTKGRKTNFRITKRHKVQKVEKQKVKNYKAQKKKCQKLQEVLKHELFSYKVRNLLTATVQYMKNPLGFFL